MTNKELQQLLAQFPDDFPVKILRDHRAKNVSDFNEECVMQTTDKAWIDSEAPVEEWDTEDGKIVYDGNPFLLINPIIV